LDFCKRDIGPIFFPEIGSTISGKNHSFGALATNYRIGKEESLRDFSFPK
jgi:hypothetical protein